MKIAEIVPKKPRKGPTRTKIDPTRTHGKSPDRTALAATSGKNFPRWPSTAATTPDTAQNPQAPLSMATDTPNIVCPRSKQTLATHPK